MAEYIALDTELTSVANAIRQRGATNAPLAFPEGFVSAIMDIPNGSESSDVIFYDDLANDCRGGIVASYSAAEFAQLTAMPSNPDHHDFSVHGISIPMTSQGWNWSLADAKAYVAKHGKLNIGQMYIPTDGKTHYICFVPLNAPAERWNTQIDISVTGGSANWQIGNGALNTTTGSISVVFPSVGWHDVKISAPNNVSFYPASTSNKSYELIGRIQKITYAFFGNDVERIGDNAFTYCYSLLSVTIPHGVTSIDDRSLWYCNSMSSVTIPSGVTSIGNYGFNNCNNMKYIALPNDITSIGEYVFQGCFSMPSITIPDSVTSLGKIIFGSCYSLASIAMPDNITELRDYTIGYCYSLSSFTIPSGVTSIGNNTFQSCYCLSSVIIPNGVTSIGNYAFLECIGLTSITIPDSVTNLGERIFSKCYSLASVEIPDSITTIKKNTFGNCYSLTSITIPDSVTSIENIAFDCCYSLKNIILECSTPPVLSNVNAFGNLMNDYSIIVPAGSLSAYTSATNWSTLASHIVEAT